MLFFFMTVTSDGFALATKNVVMIAVAGQGLSNNPTATPTSGRSPCWYGKARIVRWYLLTSRL
jgi:hypothetical protein